MSGDGRGRSPEGVLGRESFLRGVEGGLLSPARSSGTAVSTHTHTNTLSEVKQKTLGKKRIVHTACIKYEHKHNLLW